MGRTGPTRGLIVWVLLAAWLAPGGPIARALPSVSPVEVGRLAIRPRLEPLVEPPVQPLAEPPVEPPVEPLVPPLVQPPVEASIRLTPGDVPSGDVPSCDAASRYRFLEGELSRLEQDLFRDAADGRWDEHRLLGAALVASGVSDARALRRYEKQVARLVAELRRSGRVAGSPRRRAQAVFELMHERILRGGYQLECSDLALALDEGRFNCVSASVLFNCLAGRFGLTVRGVEIPGHAMSRLILPDGALDVETTCPAWFRLIDDPEKQAELVRQTLGLRPGQNGAEAEPRQVSDVQLVATIYYNRGVDLLAEKRFARAVAANAKALRLDPANTTARGNLLATVNNWAIDRSGGGDHAGAIALLRQGITLAPDYETFQVNYVYVHSQRIDELCGSGGFREALALVAQAAAERIDEGYFRQARLDVYRRWARACLDAGQWDLAFAALDEAKRRHGSPEEVLGAEVEEVRHQAADLLGQGRPAEAVALLDRAIARQPRAAVLAENRREAVTRWAQAALHEGQYAEAIRRATHGARPGQLHQALVKDVRYGYYHWISRLLAEGRRVEAKRIARQAKADPFLGGRTEGAIPRFPGK